MDEKATAYHEAGHAAIALMFGIDFKTLTIKPVDDILGHIDYGRQRTTFKGLLAVAGSLEMLLAGGVAEAIFLKKNLGGVAESMAHDLHVIEKFIKANPEQLHTLEVAPFLNWLEARTFVHVKQRWKYVEKIAQALLKKKSLTCEECKKIIAS